MHLDEVVIEGFKSFTEPTHMGFQPGIGVIIGNNGVGKSNILDAIVWALGEDDMDRLRCQEPGELFFAGNKSCPAAAEIRVELRLRTGPERQATMASLVRGLTSDGGESYRIDDQWVNRETYTGRVAALGLGNGLKTIIRQEQINDMISLRPHLRFGWIHELIGNGDPEGTARCLREEIAPRFQEYLAFLLPDLEAELRVTEGEEGAGVEIELSLQRRALRKAHQLSGGQKAVASLALKLALFEKLDSPLYLLDEVEPSLDYAHHKSMQALLRMLARKRQLVMITHLRSTVELANTVHGVRTRMDGSSFMKFYFVMDERLLRLYKCC
jgi:chromosome segregation protein